MNIVNHLPIYISYILISIIKKIYLVHHCFITLCRLFYIEEIYDMSCFTVSLILTYKASVDFTKSNLLCVVTKSENSRT